MSRPQRIVVAAFLLAVAAATAWLLSPPDIWSTLFGEGSWFTEPVLSDMATR